MCILNTTRISRVKRKDNTLKVVEPDTSPDELDGDIWPILLRAVLDTAMGGWAVVGPDGGLLVWNDQFVLWLKRSGLVPANVLAQHSFRFGLRLFEIFPELINPPREVSNRMGRVYRVERHKVDQTGRTVDIMVLRDITEQKMLDRALSEAVHEAEQAHRAKQTFVTQVAHEFRTPLNVILGYTSLLVNNGVDPGNEPDLQEWLSFMHTSAQSMLTHTNDMIEIMRIETQQIEIEPYDIEIHTLFKGLLPELEDMASAKGVRLEAQTCLDAMWGATTKFDRQSLRKALRHTIATAISLTEPADTIWIRFDKRQYQKSAIEVRIPSGLYPAGHVVELFEQGRPLSDIGLIGSISSCALNLAAAHLRLNGAEFTLADEDDGLLVMRILLQI